jgi:glucokinase
MSKKIPILAGDIGGTNSRLTLLKISANEDDEQELIENKYFLSFNFQNVYELLTQFLKPYKGTPNYPRYAVFGVPGPIKNNTVLQFTNVIHWNSINGEELAKTMGIEKIVFLNDFVANGFGIQTKMKEDVDYVIINDKPIDPNGPKATLGPGTGLGVGYLTKKEGDKYYLVCGAEGSHSDFAPVNEQQFQYMLFLQKYYHVDHISTERATCGQAIIPIYKFFCQGKKDEIPPHDEELFKEVKGFEGTTNSDAQIQINNKIVSKGLNKECELCEKTLNFFMELYGQAAGNISLMYLPSGGLYLLGGLSVAFQDLIINSDIWKNAFKAKGRLSSVLENTPVILIKVHDLGMRGSTEYCRRLIEEAYK